MLLHGEPTWGYLWRHLVGPLSGTHRVVVADHKGFGKSAPPPRPPRAPRPTPRPPPRRGAPPPGRRAGPRFVFQACYQAFGTLWYLCARHCLRHSRVLTKQ
ncbi:alpha/beta fold hydrolase [Nocardia wallacei]|uniref:alpha/beta fold hydrolase n=1 Tax=Nocardia wallacei TaxID=480035 RepID=UPI003CC7F7B7